MSKPRVVEIKRPEVKKGPKVVKQEERERGEGRGVVEEDFSLIIGKKAAGDEASQELRKQQLRDIVPAQPKPGEPIQAIDEETRKKIEVDRKKRRGVLGDVKDALGLR